MSDPGEGWREVTEKEFTHAVIAGKDPKMEVKYWVREEPVPPLPTEPYTVIRVTWRESEDDRLADLLVRGEEQWSAVEVDQWYTVRNLPEAITGFEVLAEPRTSLDVHRAKSEASVRRETAKAVLDRMKELHSKGFGSLTLDKIALEFGVES